LCFKHNLLHRRYVTWRDEPVLCPRGGNVGARIFSVWVVCNRRMGLPSRHHSKGGPSDQKNAQSLRFREDVGGFPIESQFLQKENHPVCVCVDGYATLFDDADTPPCGDARRGIRWIRVYSAQPLFTPTS